MNVSFRDVTWRGQGGLTLYARDYGGANDKLPVVCIPGLTRNARDFEEVAPWIASQGRRVLVVDLRGRGRSERDSDPRRYHPRVYADDVAALLGEIGAKRAIFVGTSLGGLVTMTLAVRRPHLIGGAVLNDVGPKVAKAGVERIRSYAGKSSSVRTWDEAAAYTKRTNGAAFPDLADEKWAEMARRLFRDDGGTPVLDYDPAIFKPPSALAMWLAGPVMWRLFKRLGRCGPLSLIYGAITDVLDQATIRRMQLAAPALRVAAVPRVGHAPLLTESEALDAIRFWLNECP